MKHIYSAALVLASAGLAKAFVLPQVNNRVFCSAMYATSDLYSLTGTKSDGSTLNMDDLKGKVIYATNVASR